MSRAHRVLAVPAVMTVLAVAPTAATATVTESGVPAPASQDCGAWRDPVLCRAEYEARLDGGRWESLRSDTLALAPDAELELQLRGRDQYGREFRSDRLAVGYDDRDCDRLLDVDQPDARTLRIRTGDSSGACRLYVFVPGNLNFDVELEVEVSRSTRAGYERDDATTIVTALYQAILGRDPDTSSVEAAVREVEAGRLREQVEAMFRSQEFLSIDTRLDSRQILEQLYQGLLGRPLDGGGEREYLPDVERRRFADVVEAIVASDEFARRLGVAPYRQPPR